MTDQTEPTEDEKAFLPSSRPAMKPAGMMVHCPAYTEQNKLQHRLFPRWSIPLLAAIVGLTLAVALYSRPRIEVYILDEPTTTIPAGDQVEVTP